MMSDEYSILSQEQLLTVVGEKDQRIEELEAENKQLMLDVSVLAPENERLRAVYEAAKGVAYKPEFTATTHDWARLFEALHSVAAVGGNDESIPD